MTVNPFQKATKTQLKARVALDGPSGAGKTWTALEWAEVLAKDEPGRIAVVDTEHGSASLYADRFDFDTLPWDPPYDPTKLAETIKQAAQAGYAVLVVDSLSHFWEGEGGTLDVADAAGQRSGGNSFAGWKVATPALRHLVDTILASPMHVIATMRTKTEWVIEQNEKGKNVPKRVGVAPVMRQGIEYEFTVVGDMDLEHRIAFTKSRCPQLADVMVQPKRAQDAAAEFLAWLNAGDPLVTAGQAEGLVAVMNGVVDDELRAVVKREFVEVFGKPSLLPAARLGEAEAWVVARCQVVESLPAPDGSAGSTPPDGGSGGQTEEVPTSGETNTALTAPSAQGSVVDPEEAPANVKAGASKGVPSKQKRLSKLHAMCTAAFTDPALTPSANRARVDTYRHALCQALTNGATDSSSELGDDALELAFGWLDDIKAGRAELVLDHLGGEPVLRRVEP